MGGGGGGVMGGSRAAPTDFVLSSFSRGLRFKTMTHPKCEFGLLWSHFLREPWGHPRPPESSDAVREQAHEMTERAPRQQNHTSLARDPRRSSHRSRNMPRL